MSERATLLATAHDKAAHATATDDLTGLFNRRYLRAGLESFLSRAQTRGRPFTVVALDLDGLKRLNDKVGHAAGDAFLRAVAQVLREELRPEDLAIRLGGDEFLAVLADADATVGRLVASRIQDAVGRLALEVPASISAGVAQWKAGQSVREMLEAADAELYRAKRERHAP